MQHNIPIWFYSDNDAIVKATWIVDGVDAGQFEAPTQDDFPQTFKTKLPLSDAATRLTLKGEVVVDKKTFAMETTWNVGNAAPKTKMLRDKNKSFAMRLAEYLNSIDAFENGEPLAEPANLARSIDGDADYQAKVAKLENSIGAKIPAALKELGKSDLRIGDECLHSIVNTGTVLEALRANGYDTDEAWGEESLPLFNRSFVIDLHAMDGVVVFAWDPQAQSEKRPAWFRVEEGDGPNFLTDAKGAGLSAEAAILSTLDECSVNDHYFESLVEKGAIGPGGKATEDDWIVFDSSHPGLSLQLSLSFDESSSTAELDCWPRLYSTT